MTDVTYVGVTTRDGKTPIYEPNAPWKIWNKNEIYMGPNSVGVVYVPKVNDYVKDIELNIDYIVRDLDTSTWIPTLVEKRYGNMNYVMSETDVLFGVGPGTQADTYRVYRDDSVNPPTMCIDTHCTVNGTMCQYAKLFLGADTSASTGKVISQVYDANKNLISNSVPLELVQSDSHTNYSTKVVSQFNATEPLADRDLVTVVFYSANGHVVSKRQLLVENTAFIRSLNSNRRYVTGLGIKSPFLAPNTSDILNFPLNVPVNAMNLTGVVYYSDGDSIEYEVNGTKFNMMGLDTYVSTIPYENLDLVLQYTLGSDEIAIDGLSLDGKTVNKKLKLITTDVNNSYNVKLYVYPAWDATNNYYKLNWFLFNLDRNIAQNVTPYVTFADNSGGFNPTAYNTLQRKSVRINLRDVSGAFKPFIHTQLVDIVLKTPPNARQTPWLVSPVSATNKEPYGSGMVAIRTKTQPTTGFKIDGDSTSLENWLEKTYYRVTPLVDIVNESEAPKPTHIEVSCMGAVLTKSIANWNSEFDLGIQLNMYSNVHINFIYKVGSITLLLACCEMMICP